MGRRDFWLLALALAAACDEHQASNPDAGVDARLVVDAQVAAEVSVDSSPAANTLVIRSGTTGELTSTCRVGVIAVETVSARLSWWSVGGGEGSYPSVRADVAVQALFPACGQLHRLLSVGDQAVTIDRTPVPPPADISLRADGVAIPLMGTTTLRPDPNPSFTIEVTPTQLTSGPAPTASLALRETAFATPGGPPTGTKDRTQDVRSDQWVGVGTEVFLVLAVVPPRPELGIAGWVEFNPRRSTLTLLR